MANVELQLRPRRPPAAILIVSGTIPHLADSPTKERVFGRSPVQPAKEFRNYAASCQQMAGISCDPEGRSLWLGMAERWLLCAKLAEAEETRIANEKARKPCERRRPPTWRR
jgi:hypothetical protein